MRTLDYDYSKLKMDTNLKLSVALRAKKLDQVTADSWPATRKRSGSTSVPGSTPASTRLGDPAGVDWYDVDFPAVAAVRERLIPLHSNGHVIAADVRDPGWLDAIPNDRPAIIVADGLMGFLTEDEMVTLWNRLVDHFPSGELVFNGYTRFAVWVATARARLQVGRRDDQVPRHGRPPGTRAWNPNCDWSGRSCSAESPRSPSSRRLAPAPPADLPQHHVVPDGELRSALPLLRTSRHPGPVSTRWPGRVAAVAMSIRSQTRRGSL